MTGNLPGRGLSRLEVEAIAAFLANSAGVVDGIGRDVDDVDERGAGVLAGAARGGVVRIAGDPQVREAVAAGERHEQHNGASSEASSAEGRIHAITDVAGVADEVLVPSKAEIDVAGFGVRRFLDDGEEAGRDLMDGVRRETSERKAKAVVLERPGVEERGDERWRIRHGERIAEIGVAPFGYRIYCWQSRRRVLC